MKSNQKNMRFIWLGLYALLVLGVGGRWNFPLAAWVAPIFAIRFYRDSEKGGRAFLLLWITQVVVAMIAWRGATAMAFIHPVAEPIFFALITPITLLAYVIDRIYYRRWSVGGISPFWVTLVYPISATALDFFSAAGSPFGTFGAGGYTQGGMLALMQITSLVGMWGITFIVSWFASVLSYVWEHGFNWGRVAHGVYIYAGVLVLVLGFGAGRLLLAAPVEEEVMIGGFSLPETQLVDQLHLLGIGKDADFREAAREVHAAQLAQVRVLAQEGAQMVSLQEGAGMGFAEEVDALLIEAAVVAREEGIYLVLPTGTLDPAGEALMKNVVYIIDPQGEIVLEHYKYGGTQFEGSVTGSGELQTVETPYGLLSAVICWDADFPQAIKQAGAQGIDLLFVPSNDWFELRDIHADMATFRAVENGVSIYRQTGAGVSIVTDAYGRVLNRVDIFEEDGQPTWGGVQMVQTPLGSVDTAFVQVSDAFGGLMLVSTLGLLVVAWWKRKRK